MRAEHSNIVRVTFVVIIIASCFLSSASAARGQSPAVRSAEMSSPASGGSLLGNIPGADRTAPGGGAQERVIGGRAGPGVPRVMETMRSPELQRRLPATAQPIGPSIGADLPRYGALTLPEEEGPEAIREGMTLDQAIERLIAANLDLRAKAIEMPKAQADILTASLRNNPLFYADSQLVPYGNFSKERPGGPTQYDVNVTFPLDVSGKRRARTTVACRARRVVEALFQDAVRLKLDELYTAYVDAIAARDTLAFIRVSIGEPSRGEMGAPDYVEGSGLSRVLELAEQRRSQGFASAAEVGRVRLQLTRARVALEEADAQWLDARMNLAALLALPLERHAEGLKISGGLVIPGVPELTENGLIQSALEARPDLRAYQLGLQRAEAEVGFARANRFENLFLLAQPYTFQDNAPFDRKSAHSWAVGLTVPLPLFNRNQGNIERAHLNFTQTQIQLADIERQITAEAIHAEHSYSVTKHAVETMQEAGLKEAAEILRTSWDLYKSGDRDLQSYLDALSNYNDVAWMYRDALVRHRRAMLRLNTVVGRRVVP